jgi:hypothetical protein
MKTTACERRIAALQASANTYKTPYLRNRALGAIAKTQECCQLCKLLVERTVKASEAITRRSDEKSAKLAEADRATRAKWDKLKQDIESVKAKGTDEVSRQIIDARATGLLMALTDTVMGSRLANLQHNLDTIAPEAATALVIHFFADIVDPDETHFQLNSFIKGIEAVAVSLPVLAEIVAIPTYVVEMLTARHKEDKIADSRVQYFDAFELALGEWKKAALVIISLLDSLDY